MGIHSHSMCVFNLCRFKAFIFLVVVLFTQNLGMNSVQTAAGASERAASTRMETSAASGPHHVTLAGIFPRVRRNDTVWDLITRYGIASGMPLKLNHTAQSVSCPDCLTCHPGVGERGRCDATGPEGYATNGKQVLTILPFLAVAAFLVAFILKCADWIREDVYYTDYEEDDQYTKPQKTVAHGLYAVKGDLPNMMAAWIKNWAPPPSKPLKSDEITAKNAQSQSTDACDLNANETLVKQNDAGDDSGPEPEVGCVPSASERVVGNGERTVTFSHIVEINSEISPEKGTLKPASETQSTQTNPAAMRPS